MSDNAPQASWSFSELHQLVYRQLNGQLSDLEMDRLENLVCDCDAARTMYVQYMIDSARLRRWAARAVAHQSVPLTTRIFAASRETCAELAGWFSRLSPRWIAVGIAGAVVQAVLLFVLLLPGENKNAVDNLVGDASLGSSPPSEVANDDSGSAAGAHPQESAKHVAAWLVDAEQAEWAGDFAPQVGEPLFGDSKLDLRSGLAKIEFRSGATVVLQAPITWQVVSPLESRLLVGRLTARVPASASGYTVVLPTGKVVDYGTEFGVEVAASGDASVHVFEGEVEAAWLSSSAGVDSAVNTATQTARRFRLTAGQSSDNRQTEPRPAAPEIAQRFARTVRPPSYFPLFGSGHGLAESEVEPRWQVRHETEPDKWQAALVMRRNDLWVPNSPQHSQWISAIVDGNASVAAGRWIYRTRFSLEDFDISTAKIIGRFAADNVVEAITLNGEKLRDHPGQGWFDRFEPFEIKSGFANGENTIEFVVINEGNEPSATGLRVEWSGLAEPKRAEGKALQ